MLDLHPPSVTKMQIITPASAESPYFQLLIAFTEPVTWITSAPDNTGQGPNAQPTSGVLLTNAALINISIALGSATLEDDGTAASLASSYLVWLKSWSGTKASITVLGAAYQDAVGNSGQQVATLQVQLG